MYLKFSMDPYPNSVHEDHLKHKAPKINVQNSTLHVLLTLQFLSGLRGCRLP
jgi:hypothetical protein